PAPLPVSPTEPVATIQPGETPLSIPTVTQTIIPAPLPSATTSPAQLIRRARPICENSFSALVESGPLTPPFAVMKKIAYADSPSWDLAHQLPHLGTLAGDEVQSLLCISETREQVGTYTDGAAAYQLFWDVRAVSWPGGKVIGRKSFTGSPPPQNGAFASSAAEGSFPVSAFAAWVFHEVDHPDFLYFEDAVTSLAVTPSGNLAAFGTAIANRIVDRDYPAQIFLLRASDLEIISTFDGHQGMVTSLAFSSDGRTLASSGYDLFVKFWDVGSSQLLGQVHIADTPNSLVFSPDGNTLAVASNLDVAFIDIASMQIEQSLQEASGNDLTFAPDGQHVYVRSLGSIKLIDAQANIVMLTFPDSLALVPTLSVAADGNVIGVTYEYPEAVDGFALSPDGESIVSYTLDASLDSTTDAENVRLAVWDAVTGKFLSETRFSAENVQNVEFSPSGTLLAIGAGSEIWVWDTETWQVEKKLTGHIGDIVDVAFDREGSRVFSAGSDGTVRAWSLDE
ncbi:MAG: hypothetical protein M3Y68_01960, partial [Chloroflexota bacterium]|nr:hypothetical protein [Chloroflexota bacterium]